MLADRFTLININPGVSKATLHSQTVNAQKNLNATSNRIQEEHSQKDIYNLLMNLTWISPKTEKRGSPIEGRGLFAKENMAKDEIVAVKGGYIFDRKTLETLQALGPAEVQIAEDLFIGPVTESEREGAMMHLNHSCNPNIGVRGEIVFVAMRDIAAGEELTFDYAMTDNDDYEMKCNCGTKDCRKVVKGKDWQKKDLQEKYGIYFSTYLQEKITDENS